MYRYVLLLCILCTIHILKYREWENASQSASCAKKSAPWVPLRRTTKYTIYTRVLYSTWLYWYIIYECLNECMLALAYIYGMTPKLWPYAA